MSRPKNTRIPTQSAPAGLFNAFANLNIEGLPEVAESAPPVSGGSRRSVECAAGAAPCKPGRVVLRRETAHRGGKCVVVLDGFDSTRDDACLQSLARRLRAACGCGGAVKGRTVELQGDQVPRIRQLLAAEGFQVAGES